MVSCGRQTRGGLETSALFSRPFLTCPPANSRIRFMTESRLRVLQLVRDEIPNIRRSRRRTRTTKIEEILVLKKRADTIRAVEGEPIAVADALARKLTRGRRPCHGLDEHGAE